MAKKVAILIDGAYMVRRINHLKREISKKNLPSKDPFLTNNLTGHEIWKYCHRHIKGKNTQPNDNEDRYPREFRELYRVFYYDSAPLSDRGYHHPISQQYKNFNKSTIYKQQTELHDSIRTTPNFALRLGRVKWNQGQWLFNQEKTTKLIKGTITVNDFEEHDIKPSIIQKGVDMKIGLDVASIAYKKLADVIILISGDADMIPALKLARIEGVQVGIDPLYGNTTKELREHVDFLTSHLNVPTT